MVELDPLTIIALVVSIGSAIFVAFGVRAQQRILNESKRLNFFHMLRYFKIDLQQVYLDTKVESYQDFERFTAFFLNTLDRMVHLRESGRIDDEIMNFFLWDFRFALNLRDIEEEFSGRDITRDWKTYRWCKQRQLHGVPLEEWPDEIRNLVEKHKKKEG